MLRCYCAPLLDDAMSGLPAQISSTTGPERRITRWEHGHVLKPCNNVSIRNARLCAYAGRRLSILSARSRCGWCDAFSEEAPTEGCYPNVLAAARRFSAGTCERWTKEGTNAGKWT